VLLLEPPRFVDLLYSILTDRPFAKIVSEEIHFLDRPRHRLKSSITTLWKPPHH